MIYHSTGHLLEKLFKFGCEDTANGLLAWFCVLTKPHVQYYDDLSLAEQKEKFKQSLLQHMQDSLQRDDILWMGLKI